MKEKEHKDTAINKKDKITIDKSMGPAVKPRDDNDEESSCGSEVFRPSKSGHFAPSLW